ncbi:hypothetical protein CPB85DRAFT_1568296 [Mucidula mucida]|nr:hypothetical protein CPB85DRAFT_1568296 [Mucidula mucida]
MPHFDKIPRPTVIHFRHIEIRERLQDADAAWRARSPSTTPERAIKRLGRAAILRQALDIASATAQLRFTGHQATQDKEWQIPYNTEHTQPKTERPPTSSITKAMPTKTSSPSPTKAATRTGSSSASGGPKTESPTLNQKRRVVRQDGFGAQLH